MQGIFKSREKNLGNNDPVLNNSLKVLKVCAIFFDNPIDKCTNTDSQHSSNSIYSFYCVDDFIIRRDIAATETLNFLEQLVAKVKSAFRI